MTASSPPALAFREVSKRFGSTQALNSVSFSVARGSIHGLLGGNGSGKSTLIKALAGVEQADSGTIEVHGATSDASQVSPAWARDSNIHFVHQDFGIFTEMTVTENLSIGRGFERSKLGGINWRQARRRAGLLLERFGIEAKPDDAVSSLSPATQTLLAIARTLQDQDDRPGVLVLDEPTVALPDNNVDTLLDAVRGFAENGQTILFVSHRLGEVFSVTDTVTILRDGVHIETLPTERLTREGLIEMMAGEAVEHAAAALVHDTQLARQEWGDDKLRVSGLRGGKLEDVSFEHDKGTVLGIAGLLGSGRSSLLQMLGGVLPAESGGIELDGEAVRLPSHKDALRQGIVYIPEDRGIDGLFLDSSVAMNLNAARVKQFSKRGWLSHRAELSAAREDCRRFGVKTAKETSPITSLSGGNQQKVLLGRWISLQPRVLLLDEPTKGVDVKSRSEIYDLIQELVEAGSYVIVASSDFEELNLLCDRILMLDRGSIRGEIDGHRSSAIHIGRELHRIQLERVVN